MLSSRTEAKNLIAEGAVFVNGVPVTKPSMTVDGFEDKIFVDKSKKQFVSRGGIKLHGAITAFGIDVSGRVCIDIGASSGGFTDCLLKNGATTVIAVDSGRGQLVEALRCDPRVVCIENYNARYIKASDFEYSPTVAVMDVSFISATYIIPGLSALLPAGSDYICLIKPQFEVGKAGLGKGGIVRDERVRAEAVRRVTECAEQNGFRLMGVITSPIKGGDGNVEFLAHFVRL